MKKLIYIICVGLGASVQAQDVHFSQFYETGAVLNPGQTGLSNERIRVGLQYRDQWSVINKTYRTGLIHVDAPLLSGKNRNANIGLGGYAFYDRAGAGALGQTEAALQVSGMVKMADGHWLGAGVRTAYTQYTASNTDFEWGLQFDGTGFNGALNSFEAAGMQKTNAFDISAGFGYHYSSSSNSVSSRGRTIIHAGVAYHHIASPSIGFFDNAAELPGRIVAMFSGRFDLGTGKTGIIPVAYYSRQQKQQEISAGAIFRYGLGTTSKYTGFMSESELGAGMLFRLGDAIIPTIRFQTAHIGVGVSYDITVSQFGGAVRGNGGWEISLRLMDIGGMAGGTSGKSML